MKKISLNISDQQKLELQKSAEDNNLSISDYIKTRLFDEQESPDELSKKILSKYEKNLISVVFKNYYVSQLLVKKISSEEEINNAINKANQILKDKGYKDNYEVK